MTVIPTEERVFGVVTYKQVGDKKEPVRLIRKRFDDDGDGVGRDLAKFMAAQLNIKYNANRRGNNADIFWVEDVTGEGEEPLNA